MCWGLYNILDWKRNLVSVSKTEFSFRVGNGNKFSFPCRNVDRFVCTYEKWIQVEAVSSNQIFVLGYEFPLLLHTIILQFDLEIR